MVRGGGSAPDHLAGGLVTADSPSPIFLFGFFCVFEVGMLSRMERGRGQSSDVAPALGVSVEGWMVCILWRMGRSEGSDRSKVACG